MVLDFFAATDVGTPAAGEWVHVPFGAVMDSQAVSNAAGFIVQFSFDGSTVHGELAADGVTSALSWERHNRGALYLRRKTGAAGAAAYAQVFASVQP